ncbi:interphotoreceptor matrix proteoglycan 2-like [Takifugu flavidus]|uniref:interphotoreceptor matrix proteoglycan 2-like n=1 Tax=Takifugu flavidus TaxID=433684 RepID=UPI002544C8F1|nr:interphotoreceptor matrix proteoglycan 2-like [Takifugu flavidus]
MTTTTSAAVTISVSFRSRLSTFSSDLQDTSSEAFKSRASMIKSQLQPLFQAQFSSFRFMEVVSFRNGSVINDMTLGFDSTAVPHHTVIASVLINASSIVTGFDIEGSSISVDGIASSGVRQNISLITAFSLILLSWLLSNYQ